MMVGSNDNNDGVKSVEWTLERNGGQPSKGGWTFVFLVSSSILF
jgi:hypothetical protein